MKYLNFKRLTIMKNANETPQKYLAKSVKSLQSNCGVSTVPLVSIKVLQILVNSFFYTVQFLSRQFFEFSFVCSQTQTQLTISCYSEDFIGQEFMVSALLHEKQRDCNNHKPGWESTS